MYSKKQVVKTVAISCIVALVTGIFGTAVYFKINNFLNEDILVKAKNLIAEKYVDTLTEEQTERMEDFALTAMVAALYDPYSYCFDMETFDKFEDNNQEEYVGIGISVVYDAESEILTVMALTANSPAERAGILPQDKILSADDLTLKQHGYDAIIDHIKGGTAGDVIKILIDRDGKEMLFDVTREIITVDTISGKMLDNDIAYIKISKFKHNSIADFSAALEDIKSKNAKGLIIDLRSNPGGYADSVIKMTDMLLPEGTIAYLEDNKGNKEYFKSDKNFLDMPMVVLVNEGTASASELMAGSLKAYDKAKIVGMKTYGKAVGQTPYMLTDETAIYLTTARYYTPKGECIDKQGITPDVEIDMPDELKMRLSSLTEDEDIQLKKAIETIMTIRR